MCGPAGLFSSDGGLGTVPGDRLFLWMQHGKLTLDLLKSPQLMLLRTRLKEISCEGNGRTDAPGQPVPAAGGQHQTAIFALVAPCELQKFQQEAGTASELEAYGWLALDAASTAAISVA